MEKIITYPTLRRFAYSNDHLIQGEIRGAVISFYGLGDMRMFADDPAEAVDYARQGILYIVPYTNPWCWMNRSAVRYTDEIIEVLCKQYRLNSDLKIVSTGGSMGGLSALVYSYYATVTPVACVVNCPVCDLPFHFTEREDLPRTLYSAFAECDYSLEEALAAHSPLHLAEKMPAIPYTLFHCTADRAVNIDAHSRKFVQAMRPTHEIALIEVPQRGHCDLTSEALEQYRAAILQAIG